MNKLSLLYTGIFIAQVVTFVSIFLIFIRKDKGLSKERFLETASQAEKTKNVVLPDEVGLLKRKLLESADELNASKKQNSELNNALLKMKALQEQQLITQDALKSENAICKKGISDKNNELNEALAQKEKAVLDLEERNARLEQDKSKSQEANLRLQEIEDSFHKLEAENVKLKEVTSAKIKELEESVTQKDSIILELKGKKFPPDNLQIADEEAVLRLKELESGLNKSQLENMELKQRFSEIDRQLDTALADKEKAEESLSEKDEELEDLETELEKLRFDSKDFPLKIKALNDQIKELNDIIAANKSGVPGQGLSKEKAALKQARLDEYINAKKEKIGEILLKQKFVTPEVLSKALEYQRQYGGNITQYLLAYSYIDERQLAQCLCTQFAIPYLPLSAYAIKEDIIKLIPVDVAEKNWLIPVERVGNSIMVVMADPLDVKAIREVEAVTGFSVQPFVGILSEIIEALENYYKVKITEKSEKGKKVAPFFIDSLNYKGMERRQAYRFRAAIDIAFPFQDTYIKAKTVDISRSGLLFEFDSTIPVGSVFALQINLPKEITPLPILTVVEVARVVQLKDNRFGIGVKMIKISTQEINEIIKYAAAHLY